VLRNKKVKVKVNNIKKFGKKCFQEGLHTSLIFNRKRYKTDSEADLEVRRSA